MRSLRLLCIFGFLWLVTPVSRFVSPSLAAEASETQNESQQSSGVRVNRPILRSASQGTEVSELQAALKLLGYYTGKVDGIYSETTANAVIGFQQAAGLTPDGVVGAETWNRLFPAVPTAAGNSSTSSPANSAAAFPVPSATRKISTNSSLTANSASSRTPRQATTATAPRTNQQATATGTARTNNRQLTTTAAARTYNQQATNSGTARTNNRQVTNASATRTNNRQATNASAARTYNQQATRRSTSQAQSNNDSSSQNNLPILRLGAQGSAVNVLQRRLRNLGFYKGKVSGTFDEATQGAVQSAQQRFQLEPDGVVGPATWGILMR